MAARKTPGSPKGDKLMRDALALELSQQVSVDGLKMKRLRVVARRLVDNAADGDTAAIREIFDRMDGRVPQGINAEHTGKDGAPLIPVINLIGRPEPED